MKILITGGAGFIGSHLVEAYLARGDEIVIVDDLSTGSKKNIQICLDKGARLYEIPIQSPKLKEILEKEKPDLVSHHAAQKSVRDSVTDPIHDADINIMGLLNLLEASRLANVRRFIYSSSGGVVYGEQEKHPATENHPKRPASPYGVSKYASELYFDFYCMNYGIDATCLRYANIYGPRQDPLGEAGVIAIFCKKLKAADKISIYGNGKQTRDFVYVGDIVEANLVAEKVQKGFQAWNIGTGIESSILEVYSQLAEIYKSTIKPTFESAKPGEQLRSVLDASAFQKISGWAPKIKLNEGLKKTHEWFSLK